MSDLDDSFAKLLGRQPSDAERQSLYRVRDALGLNRRRGFVADIGERLEKA